MILDMYVYPYYKLLLWFHLVLRTLNFVISQFQTTLWCLNFVDLAFLRCNVFEITGLMALNFVHQSNHPRNIPVKFG